MSPQWLVGILALFFLVTLVATSPAVPVNDEEDKKDADVEKRGTDFGCYINGRMYQHGEVFTFPGFSRCVKYRCNNGGYNVVQSACERNGQCVAVGSTIRDKCRSLRCQSWTEGNAQHYRLQATVRDMCEINGRCVQKYHPFMHSNCAEYKCIPTQSGGYNFIPTGSKMCKGDNNRCYNVGANFAMTINSHYYRNCVCQTGGRIQCRG